MVALVKRPLLRNILFDLFRGEAMIGKGEVLTNPYYSYNVADIKNLIEDLRLRHFKNADAFHENVKGVVVFDPCESTCLTEALDCMLSSVFDLEMVLEGTQPWKNQPQYFLIPVLEIDGMQWRLLRIRLDYTEGEIAILIHDPLGKHDWPKIEDIITDAFGPLLSGGLYLTIQTIETAQHQRRYETGPLLVKNIECHLNCLDLNEKQIISEFTTNFPEFDLKDLRQEQFKCIKKTDASDWLSAVDFKPIPLAEIEPREVRTQFNNMIGLLIQNDNSNNKAIRFTTACFLLANWLGCEPDTLVYQEERGVNRVPIALETLSNHLNKSAQSEWQPLNAFRTMTLLYITALVDTIKTREDRETKSKKINLFLKECLICLELLRVAAVRRYLPSNEIHKELVVILQALNEGESYLLHAGPKGHAAYVAITNVKGTFTIDYIDIADGKKQKPIEMDSDELSNLLNYLLNAKQNDEDATTFEDYFTPIASNSTSASSQRLRALAKEQGNNPVCICNNYIESMVVRYKEDEANTLSTILTMMATECRVYYGEEWLGRRLNFNAVDSVFDCYRSAVSVRTYNAAEEVAGHQLIGRQVLMGWLSNIIADEISSPKKSRYLIHGLPGMGKTVCAKHLITTYTDKFPFVLKCRGESEDSFKEDLFKALSGLPDYARQKIKERPTWIKQWLTNNPRWLIFVDDLVTLDWIDKYLPNQAGGIVLATSCERLEGFQTVWMDKMLDEEALQFFPDKSFEGFQKARDNLIEMLDGLPLAFCLANLYMQEEDINIIQYCALLREQKTRLEIINYKLDDDSSHISLLATIVLLCERIQNRNALAFKRLLQIAMCGSNQIPSDHMTCFSSANNEIKLLISFGLVDHQSFSMTMHKFIHTVLRDSLKKRRLGNIDLSMEIESIAKELCGILLKNFQYRGINTDEKALQKCLVLENHVRQFILVAESWLNNESDFAHLKIYYARYMYHQDYQITYLSNLVTIKRCLLDPLNKLILEQLLYKYASSVKNKELLNTLTIEPADKLINEVKNKNIMNNQDCIDYYKSFARRCEAAAHCEINTTTKGRLFKKAGQAYESMYGLRPNVGKYLDNALSYYKQALQFAGDRDERHYISLVIARIYCKKRNFNEASTYSNSCLQYFKRNNNFQNKYFEHALELQFQCLEGKGCYDDMKKLVTVYDKTNTLSMSSKAIIEKYNKKVIEHSKTTKITSFFAVKPKPKENDSEQEKDKLRFNYL